MIVWDDGVLRPAEEVRLDPADRGFLIADAAFETIAVRMGAAVRLERHLARLRATLTRIGVAWAPSGDMAGEAAEQLIAANAVTDGVLRLTVSAGAGGRGLERAADIAPRALMTVAATRLIEPALLSLRTEPAIRRGRADPAMSMKLTGSYAGARMARAAARARGFDDALLRDEGGLAACLAAANVFWIKDDALETPALNGAVLPGITRDAVLAAARSLGVRVAEAAAGPEVLRRADAAFATNSLWGCRAIARLDDADLDPDHPLIAALAEAERAAA